MNDPMRVYRLVNDQLIELLEINIIPWKDHLEIKVPYQNYFAQNVYMGVNQLILNGISLFKKYKSPYFLTFEQVNILRGRVRAKEKHTKVIYYKKKVRKDGTGYTDLQYHKVYNLDQVDGIPRNPKRKKSFDLYKEKNIIDGYINGPRIVEGEDNLYCPIDDFIEVNDKSDFLNLAYYLIKSAGHVGRLNRISCNYDDDHPLWLVEELTCQVGQSLLGALVGLCPGLKDSVFIKDRESYIKTWLPILKENPNMVINASSAARRAVNLIITGEG